MGPLIDPQKLKQILEAALFAADGPLGIEQLAKLFAHGELDSEEGRAQLRATLDELVADADGRGYQLQRVASGWRYQVRQELAEWVGRLWEEKPPRYSRALLETLALIAYKQPVTRGDIEELRGVAVSQSIMRTLVERDWIRIVGQREVPGRPALYGTTRSFLDYFNLKSLDQLPSLPEIRALIETMVLEETVPEAYATDGTNGIDGIDGLDGETEATGADAVASGSADAEFRRDESWSSGDHGAGDDRYDEDYVTVLEPDQRPAAGAHETEEPQPHLADVLILPHPTRQ